MKLSKVKFVMNSLSDSPTFKTHDLVDGEILFTPCQETQLDDISITFQGMTQIEVENMNAHVPLPLSRLQKTFLRMESPIYNCPSTNTLRSGKVHRLPFKFIVPEQLPIHACHHQCGNHQIQPEHLRLPASLSYQAQKLQGIHDMSPEMAEVIYSINLTLWQRDRKAGGSKKIQESTHPVQILPTREEHAPILVPDKNRYYQLRSENFLSKGVLRNPAGKLSACSTQPPGISLQALRPHNPDASTVVQINLRFEPASPDQLPPTLLNSEFQLRAMTFFGMDPWQDFPDLADVSTWGARQAFWSECVPLIFDRTMKVDWKTEQQGSHVFAASIVTSVSLPSHRLYPPTGHSCLVSRSYAIQAKVFYRAHGKARGSSSISLSIPVEICAI